ncbi:hypothetical protein HJ042_07900 [Vibrio parahaemolyticus]|nr:hypothetical protein [Vibrio parahaemolyticus]
MSTPEVAELIISVNELTNTVVGKQAEIDAEVEKAVTSIPQAINNYMGRVVFVDQVNGNDSNDGTLSKPYRSIEKASQGTPAGGSVDIRLLSNYLFSETESASFVSSQVRVSSYDSNRRRIKFNTAKDAENRQMLKGFFTRRGGFFNFYNVDLELPDMPTVPGIFSVYSCIVSTHFGDDMGVPLSVRLHNVGLVVPEPEKNNFMFVANHDGITMVSVGECTFDAVWVNRDKFFFGGSATDTLKASRIITKNDIIPQG